MISTLGLDDNTVAKVRRIENLLTREIAVTDLGYAETMPYIYLLSEEVLTWKEDHGAAEGTHSSGNS
jgi:hypothetical protein